MTPGTAAAPLPAGRLRELLEPYVASAAGLRDIELQPQLLRALETYLDLLLRWNARTNLTAIRAPEEIVRRHFGESLLLARLCPEGARTALDLGSGAGLPGVPLQLAWPELRVTLAESQGKKAAFLREVVRVLGLPAEVWAERAEAMENVRQFDVVAIRAVDRMEQMLSLAHRLAPALLLLTTEADAATWGLASLGSARVPGSADSVAILSPGAGEP